MALLFLVIGAEVGRVGCCACQGNRSVLRVSVGMCLAHELDGLVVAEVVECERRRAPCDARVERLTVLLELREAQVGRLDADDVGLEVREYLVVALSVAVEVLEVFLVVCIPDGEDLLLLLAHFLAHDSVAAAMRRGP